VYVFGVIFSFELCVSFSLMCVDCMFVCIELDSHCFLSNFEYSDDAILIRFALAD